MSEPSFVIINRETLERAFSAAQALALDGKSIEETQELLDAAWVHPKIQEIVQEMMDSSVLGEVSEAEIMDALVFSEEDEDA